jgi:quercetin dioxygenase-like cupin family protein
MMMVSNAWVILHPGMEVPMSGQSAGFLVDIGEGTEVSLGGLVVQFKLRAGQTGGQLSISEVRLDPHRLVPPHVHADEDEFSYVAAGTVGVRVGDEEFEAAQGSYLVKPRGVAHAFWNPADEVARTVEVVVPAGFEAFFEELAQAFATGDAGQIQQRRADLAVKYRLGYPTDLVPALKAKYGLKLIGE